VFVSGSTGWIIYGDGSVEFNDGTFRGALVAAEIHVPDENLTSNSFHTDTAGNSWWGCTHADFTVDHSNANAYVLDTGQASFANVAITGGSVDSNVLNGLVLLANTNVAAQGWTQTCAFSSSGADTVAWGSGTFTTASGTTYNIDAGDTGAMAARTYIYLDIAISTTAYQTTTTAGDAVGAGKVLIATAQNGTSEATFTVFGGAGGINIDAGSIAAGSITANEIAANTVTASNMNVSQLSAITADMGSITAGTITLPTAGNIKGGQTDFATGNGFFLGYSSDDYKFSIGDADNYVRWNGTFMNLKGSVEVNAEGVINNSVYTVANLPIPPVAIGYNNPSAYE
jgi:hypothetical protein